jgi:hypothetical protein
MRHDQETNYDRREGNDRRPRRPSDRPQNNPQDRWPDFEGSYEDRKFRAEPRHLGEPGYQDQERHSRSRNYPQDRWPEFESRKLHGRPEYREESRHRQEDYHTRDRPYREGEEDLRYLHEENLRRQEYLRERERRAHHEQYRHNQSSSDRWPDPEDYSARIHPQRHPRRQEDRDPRRQDDSDRRDRRDNYENPGR